MRRTIIFLLLLVPLLLLLVRSDKIKPVKSAFHRLVTPITYPISQATQSVGNTIKAVGSIHSLVLENARLANENTKLKAELADKLDLVHENDHLRGELGLSQRPPQGLGVAAFVVGRSSAGAFGTLTIGRGARDGIREGQVVVSQGVMVGQVGEVLETTSIVLPITNVNSLVPVALVESRGTGLLKGGVKGLSVEDISRDIPVNKGEAVITSDIGNLVPSGVLIGTVEEVSSNPADVFQAVTVKSPLAFNWLEVVVIVP